MPRIEIDVNGAHHSLDVEPRTLLVQALRDGLGLTGTHVGCDTSSCGACTVLVDGVSAKSCTIFAVQVDGSSVTTIEGIGAAADLHPMQEAFWANHGLQCGYCTPGMIVSAVDLLRRHPDPTDEQIRAGLDGNLCRCTGYENIVRAVRAAGEAMRAETPRHSVLELLPVGGEG
jgi:carbon-monoxide dehydrogenase small subunit